MFFTLALPVLYLVIFGSVFQHHDVAEAGGRIDEPVYYVPGIIAYGLIAAAFSNLVVAVVRCREAGIYKRRRTTPVSANAIIAARVLVAAASVVAITAVLVAIGWTALAAHIPVRTGPAFLLDVVVGAVVYCSLGFAAAGLVKNAICPAGRAGRRLAALLHLRRLHPDLGTAPLADRYQQDLSGARLADALLAAYRPHTAGSGLRWVDLAVLLAWGIAALVVAIRRFSWVPQGT